MEFCFAGKKEVRKLENFICSLLNLGRHKTNMIQKGL